MSSNGDLTNTDLSKSDLTSRYSYYLCFVIKQRTNKLMFHQNRYTTSQKHNHDYIKQLHDSGLGYRKISKILNDEGIRTHKGNLWYNSTVHSVLKRYKDRVNRLNIINQEYKSEWGKFEIKKFKD